MTIQGIDWKLIWCRYHSLFVNPSDLLVLLAIVLLVSLVKAFNKHLEEICIQNLMQTSRCYRSSAFALLRTVMADLDLIKSAMKCKGKSLR